MLVPNAATSRPYACRTFALNGRTTVNIMFQRYFTLKDEPWTTAAACLLFTSAALTPLLMPHRFAILLGPTWLWMCVPFLLVVAGALALKRLKAMNTLRAI